MENWVKACKKEDIELEDLIRFDYENKPMQSIVVQMKITFVLMDYVPMKMFILRMG